jgi:hypothetical protein
MFRLHWPLSLALLVCHALGTSQALPTGVKMHEVLADDSDSSSSIVSNFQDLSAVLSILASDTVEDKYTSSRSLYWERMSGVWSLFGILGVLRTCLMLVVGIAGAEAAGVSLSGAGAFTARRTSGAKSTVVVGSAAARGQGLPDNWWQDDRRRLLGLVHDKNSNWSWLRPHIVVVGFSKCPFIGTRAIRESVDVAVCVVFSIICTIGPLAILRPARGSRALWYATVGAAFVAATLASLLPVLMQTGNSIGVPRLRDIHLPTRFSDGVESAVVRNLDTVNTDPSGRGDSTSVIQWQTMHSQPWVRSGDTWTVWIMALLTSITIVGFYVLNYLLLGSTSAEQSYIWLGLQVFILAVRYFLWAYRGQLVRHRLPSILFLVTGSLVDPLGAEATTNYEQIQVPSSPWVDGPVQYVPVPKRTLAKDVVHFAVASAKSKIFGVGASTARLKLSALSQLSEVAPADFISAPYCNVRECVEDMDILSSLRVVRLPWSFVEEAYAAQGIILGNNPWALGGLYLAAVVSTNRFWGLTTVHPRTHADGAHGEDTFVQAARMRSGISRTASRPAEEGVTRCGYVIDSLEDGQVTGEMEAVDETFARWHGKFRDNVRRCRQSATENGPTHCEIHAYQMGSGEANIGRKHMTRTEETLAEAVEIVREIVTREQNKVHTRCRSHCTIYGF